MNRLVSGRPTCPVAGRGSAMRQDPCPSVAIAAPAAMEQTGNRPISRPCASDTPRLPCGGSRELVEQGEAGDLVGFTEHGHVGLQGLGVAGDVEDVVVILHQLDGGVVQTGPGGSTKMVLHW